MDQSEFNPTHSSNRINLLRQVNDAKTYLEVGVWKGDTFFNVDIENKTGVDPKFLFDKETFQSDRNQLSQTLSDDFFRSQDPSRASYDIIFLDGLHEAHQTLRDFCSSLAFSHSKTIWIIDDTIPSDIFSAHLDQAKAFQLRQQHGLSGQSWHGDVYKVIPAIDFMFNNFSFFTFATGGNPQTVLWQTKGSDRKFNFKDLESIFRMDYFGFWTVRDSYDLVAEGEASIQRIRNDFNR